MRISIRFSVALTGSDFFTVEYGVASFGRRSKDGANQRRAKRRVASAKGQGETTEENIPEIDLLEASRQGLVSCTPKAEAMVA